MANTGPLTIEQYVEVTNRNISTIDRYVYETNPPEYQDLCTVESTDRQVTQYQPIQGLSKPTRNRDLEPLPQVAPVKGYASKIVQVPYRSSVVLEESFQHYVDSERASIFDNMQDMIESEKTLRDLIAANIYNNGTTAGSTDFTEFDGTQRALFSTGHYYEDGSATYANYSATVVPPNTDTIYSICLSSIGRLKDFSGNFLGIKDEFTILTPTLNTDYGKAADQIVWSQDNPETANRSVNTVIRRFRLRHVPINNFTSSTAWYVTKSPSWRGFPIRMLVGIDRQISPLTRFGDNPDGFYSRLRSHFGVGLRFSPRGVFRQGA